MLERKSFLLFMPVYKLQSTYQIKAVNNLRNAFHKDRITIHVKKQLLNVKTSSDLKFQAILINPHS